MKAQNNVRVGYTVRELAAMLGVHKQSVYRLIYKGEIPVVRLGQKIFIPAWFIEERFSKNIAPAGGANRGKGLL